ALKTAILNEDFVRPRAGDDHSGDVDSRNVRFQVLGIAHGTELFGGKLDAHTAEEIVVGMVSGESEYKIVFQAKRAGRSLQHNAIGADLLHGAVEVRGDFASLD